MGLESLHAGKGEREKAEREKGGEGIEERADRDMERIAATKLTADCGSMVMLCQSSTTLPRDFPLDLQLSRLDGGRILQSASNVSLRFGAESNI